METKRFAKNDSGFICAHCGREVLPLRKSSRNHCPFCLWSLHLDENPGDRASDCGGEMEPVGALPDARQGFIVVHRCLKCGAVRKNKAAYGVDVQPDDIALLIALTARHENE